jgi:hypothetical protein
VHFDVRESRGRNARATSAESVRNQQKRLSVGVSGYDAGKRRLGRTTSWRKRVPAVLSILAWLPRMSLRRFSRLKSWLSSTTGGRSGGASSRTFAEQTFVAMLGRLQSTQSCRSLGPQVVIRRMRRPLNPASLVVPQRHSGIDAHRMPCRKLACEHRNEQQQDRGRDERERIIRRDADELGLQHAVHG